MKRKNNSLFSATTWALFALVQHPDVQHKLREELLYTLSTENPSMDELNSLPYLDKVVRETLRVHAPVPGTMRVAAKDDVIPLGKPFIDKKGVARDSVSYAGVHLSFDCVDDNIVVRMRKGFKKVKRSSYLSLL